MNTIRMAIIGTGGMANGHAQRLGEESDVKIIACCDVLEEKAKEFAARHSIPAWYTDYEALLDKEELDAVSVVTSDVAHAPVSIAALEHGLHVLCEKPMATSLEEAKNMVQAAKAAKKMNMIQFSYRPYPALERARQLVAEGELGTIRHVEASYLQSWLAHSGWGDWRESSALLWRLSKKHRGGALADLGCHILDFTTYVAGEIREISFRMKSFDKGMPENTCKGYVLDADDSFFATVEFASGALGVVHSTRWAYGNQNTLRLRVFGDRGALTIDSDMGKDKLQVCIGEFAGRNALWGTIPVNVTEESVFQRFVRSIRTGEPVSPTFEEGLQVQRYLEACKESGASGKSVRVDPAEIEE
ncbi:MAG: Gfo/Idh/MocA family oxidoreductase [Candidatus Latescibacterota bacterium]